MARHAEQLIEEMVENDRNPVAAYLENLRNRSAAARLIRHYGEPVVREILAALAEVPDFPPSNLLWNACHWDVPLQCFLRTRLEPVFRVLRIDDRRMEAIVTVEHGQASRRAATQEAFALRRDWRGYLVVEDRALIGRGDSGKSWRA